MNTKVGKAILVVKNWFKSNISAIILASIISIIGILIQQYVNDVKDSEQVKSNAFFLYKDMNYSFDSVNLAINISRNNKDPQIIKNPHIRTDNSEIKNLESINSKLERKESETIYTFYININLLESVRKKYWESTEQQKINYYKNEYINTLNMVEVSMKQLNIEILLEKIDNLSK